MLALTFCFTQASKKLFFAVGVYSFSLQRARGQSTGAGQVVFDLCGVKLRWLRGGNFTRPPGQAQTVKSGPTH